MQAIDRRQSAFTVYPCIELYEDREFGFNSGIIFLVLSTTANIVQTCPLVGYRKKYNDEFNRKINSFYLSYHSQVKNSQSSGGFSKIIRWKLAAKWDF